MCYLLAGHSTWSIAALGQILSPGALDAPAVLVRLDGVHEVRDAVVGALLQAGVGSPAGTVREARTPRSSCVFPKVTSSMQTTSSPGFVIG
jgi:hypothetical protein